MASSRSRNKKPEEVSNSSAQRHNIAHSKGDLVMVELVVDEYSMHDIVPGLVLKDVRDYDSFAQVHYRGNAQWTHVNRVKRIKNAKS